MLSFQHSSEGPSTVEKTSVIAVVCPVVYDSCFSSSVCSWNLSTWVAPTLWHSGIVSPPPCLCSLPAWSVPPYGKSAWQHVYPPPRLWIRESKAAGASAVPSVSLNCESKWNLPLPVKANGSEYLSSEHQLGFLFLFFSGIPHMAVHFIYRGCYNLKKNLTAHIRHCVVDM